MNDFSKLSVTSTHTVPWKLKTKTLVNKIQSKISSLERQKKRLENNGSIETEEYYLCCQNLKACKDTLNIKIEDEDDYNFIYWLYNNSNFRTEGELKLKIEEVKQKEASIIRDTDEYNAHFHPFFTYIKWLILLPFIFDLLFNLFVNGSFGIDGFDTFGITCDLFPVFLILSGIITYFYIKRHDKKYQIPTSPALVGAIAAATTAGIVAYKVTGNKKQESSAPKEV